ncbi:MAG: hypothetical protein AAF772_03125 [Acidobacteriota bacterium]
MLLPFPFSRRRTLFPALIFFLTLTGLASTASAQVAAIGDELPVSQGSIDPEALPTIAVDADGEFVVVWQRELLTSDLGDIYVRRFAVDGTPLGDEQRVNVTTLDDQVDPDVAFLNDGSYIVVWDSDNQDGSNRGIYGRLFGPDDQPLGGEIAINAITSGDQNDAVVAPAIDGGFLVAWETLQVGNMFEDVVARRFDATGTALGDEIALATTTGGDQEDLDLAAAADGTFVAVWESPNDAEDDAIIARRLAVDGTPSGAEIQVNLSEVGDQTDPDLIVFDDGGFVVAWQDDRKDGTPPSVVTRFFDAANGPIGNPFRILGGVVVHFSPRLARDGSGGAVLIWDRLNVSLNDPDVVATHLGRGFALPRDLAVTLTTRPAEEQIFGHLAIAPIGGLGLAVWMNIVPFPDFEVDVTARQIEVPMYWDNFESGLTDFWSTTNP